MASLETSELKLLEKIKAGDYTISNRMRLIGEQRRNGAVINTMTATNEITALRPVSKITDFTVRAGDEGDNLLKTVCGFRADGVLVATPTGSTAYALANGGAIIEPNASCMELTPICAHSLSMRPMIFSSDTIITVSCKLPAYDNAGAVEVVQINADGNHIADMREGDELCIRKSDKPLKLIELKPNAFYESVNGKLFQSLK
jgi:NAD+ kinase